MKCLITNADKKIQQPGLSLWREINCCTELLKHKYAVCAAADMAYTSATQRSSINALQPGSKKNPYKKYFTLFDCA